MVRYDSSTAQVLVFTFKEGLLSTVAHDLKFEVRRFSIEVDGEKISATFDPASLRVVGAMRDGEDAPGTLPAIALPEIEKNVVGAVLDVKHFAGISFVSETISDAVVTGRLTLHGRTRTISGRRLDDAGRTVAEFQFDQREFGITPYSAMLGAMKVKPEVLVRVSWPVTR